MKLIMGLLLGFEFHPSLLKFKIGLNMFLVSQVSVKFEIDSFSKLLTNLVLHL